MRNFEYQKFMRCLRKIVQTSICPENRIMFAAFLCSIPLFIIADYIEIDNTTYQVRLFESVPGFTIKNLILRTLGELCIRFIACLVTDIATTDLFYTGLMGSLRDVLGLSWVDYHKYSLGQLLIMQYEKGQATSKLIYESCITLSTSIVRVYMVLRQIRKKTDSRLIRNGFVCSIVIHLVLFYYFYKTASYLQKKVVESKGTARAVIENESKNFSVVKTTNLEKTSVDRVTQGMDHRRTAKLRLATFEAKCTFIYKLFEIISLCSVFLCAYSSLLEVAALNVVLKYVVVFYEAIRDFLKTLNLVNTEFTTFYMLENTEKEPSDINITEFNEILWESIVLDDVDTGVSLHIKKNEKIAIVGKDELEKSRIIRALCGFVYSNIKINSVEMQNIKSKSLYNLITYVSQNDSYTQGTIMKNLQYGNTRSTEEVINECKLFGVHDVIVGIEGGYEKHSDSLAVDLSGGQKQRISLMRGVLRNTPILIVDDCLSCVSTSDKDALVRNLIELKNKTLVMQCEKYDCLDKFDQILFLNGGSLKIGCFEELKGDLQTYFSIQNS